MTTSARRITLVLPRPLLDEIDRRAGQRAQNRSRFLRDALRQFLDRDGSDDLRAALIRGYQEMAALNLQPVEEYPLSGDREASVPRQPPAGEVGA